MAYMRLGDLLVASGTITGQQLERALALQKETKQRLGDVLIQNGFITEAQLIDALRVQLGVDFVDLTAISIPVELAQYVPRNIAKKYCVVPVKLVRNSLYLAMSDPLDFVAQDEVKTASRKRIIPMIATRKAVEQAIERRTRRTLRSPPPPSASLTPSSSGPIPSGPATSIWNRRRVRWWCGCASMVCSAAS